MPRLLRVMGIVLPVGAGLFVAFTEPGPINTTEAVLTLIGIFMIGFVGGFILSTWGAVVIVPTAYLLTFWITRTFTCPECHGPLYDVNIFGAIITGFIGISPMIIGSALGAFVSQRIVNQTDHKRGQG